MREKGRPPLETTPRGPVHLGVGLVVAMMVVAILGLIYIGQAPTQEPPESLQVPRAEMVEVVFDIGPFDQLCQQYVNEVGLVDYEGLQKDPGNLPAFLKQVQDVSPHSNIATFTKPEEALAYWINAYNAWMMKAVSEAYPIQSVKEIEPDVFNAEGRICGGNEKLSLNYIENEIVRKEFREPRAHFALNCASMGCPWLPKEAFDPQRLDGQLDRETRRFFADASHLKVGSETQTVFLSPILDWYKQDFLIWLQEERGIAKPNILDFVKLYAPEEVAAQIGADFEVKNLPYDWNLNDQNAEWAILRGF